MRTTIDIPDELFREIKAKAALRGQKLKDLVIEALRTAVGIDSDLIEQRVKFPLIKSRNPGHITPEGVRKALERSEEEEDLKRAFPL
jgi:hypothetical protein